MGQYVTAVGHLKKETKKELKKHAATIHCSNTLTLLQRKISNALLYHAYNELMSKEEHVITVKQLCRLIGYQGHNHAAIKEALRGLITTIIEWNLISDVTGAENWTASSIIASVSLEGPLCYYAYSPRMKQLLYTPTMFGKIDLVIQSKFRSSYGLALYENCIRYRGLPHTKWFEMDLFKKLMGVPTTKYGLFRDFKRRVLDKAVDEVNTYSDLIIVPELAREGRKVTKIRFTLKERAKKTRLGHPARLTMLDVDLKNITKPLMETFGLSEEQTEELLTTYDIKFIQDKIAMVEATKAYQEGRVDNPAAYLLSAVKRNYRAPKAILQEPVNLQDAKLEIELNECMRKVEQVRQAYKIYREEMIHEAIETLPPQEKKEFMDQFTAFAEPIINTVLQLQRNTYTHETVFQSPQLQAQLRRFALRELDFINFFSFEEFITREANGPLRDAWQKLKSYDPLHPLLCFSD